MARKPEPFYVKSRNRYFVEVGGKQINLGADKDAAWQKYYEIMAKRAPVTDETIVGTVIENYLEHVKATLSPRTYDGYSFWCNKFWAFLSAEFPNLRVVDLKPLHMTKFRASVCKQMTDNSLHGALRTVKGAFNWACKQGLIPVNPIDKIDMPRKTPREVTVTPEQWAKVMESMTDDNFRDLLIFLKETGCRPFEALTITAAHFDREHRRFVLARSESKGKKYNRVIYLNDAAMHVAEKWALKSPEGPIFRNEEGNPWKMNAINCRLRRMVKRCGFKLMPYALRHTFATEALKNKVDAVTVAQLMGHRDLTMVARVYGHLAGADEYLQDALKQATTAKPKLRTGTDG